MYTPSFAELVGDENEFFSTYFNRMPLLRAGALKGDPRQVLSIADLDQLLHFEAIRPPYIRVAKDGAGVVEAAYTTSTHVRGTDVTDVVIPERVYEFFRTGATLTWNSLNHFHPGLRALTRMLAMKFAMESDLVAFLTPAGTQGAPPHHDPVDLFVLQLEGTKHWKLWRPPAVRRCDSQHYKIEDLGDPAVEVTLQPGDVLYLPYDTPHAVATEDQVSLHLSAKVRPRLWSDLLRETVRRLLDNEEFWQFPYLTETTVADESVTFGDRAGLLAKRLQEVDLGAELRRLIATGRQSPGSSEGDTFQTIATVDAITPETRLQRTGIEVSFLGTTEGKTTARVNGHTITLPEPIARVLQRIGPAGTTTAAEVFPGVEQDRAVGAAQSLTRLGIFTTINSKA